MDTVDGAGVVSSWKALSRAPQMVQTGMGDTMGRHVVQWIMLLAIARHNALLWLRVSRTVPFLACCRPCTDIQQADGGHSGRLGVYDRPRVPSQGPTTLPRRGTTAL